MRVLEQKTMKSLVYHGPNQISLDDVPVPQIQKPTDVIVKVTLASICGSDLHVISGNLGIPAPIKMGHEFCGEVVEVGDAVQKFKVGDRVAVACVTSCGVCFHCRNGHPVDCVEENVGCFGVSPLLDGSQAEYCRVPFAENTLHHIPASLTEEDVFFVGDILSTGYFGVESVNIQPGDSVLIVGVGPVGMCAAASARLFGPSKIIVVDGVKERLQACLDNGIADVAINFKEEDVQARIKELTGGFGVDAAVECIGQETSLMTCFDAIRIGGNVASVGVFEKPVNLPLPLLWKKNFNFATGFVPLDHIPKLIQLIEEGKLNTKFLITHRSPLNDVIKGYDYFGNKKDGCIKWMLTPYER